VLGDVISELEVCQENRVLIVFVFSSDVERQVACGNVDRSVQVDIRLFELSKRRDVFRLLDQFDCCVFAHISVYEPLSPSIFHPLLQVSFELFVRVVGQFCRYCFWLVAVHGKEALSVGKGYPERIHVIVVLKRLDV